MKILCYLFISLVTQKGTSIRANINRNDDKPRKKIPKRMNKQLCLKLSTHNSD